MSSGGNAEQSLLAGQPWWPLIALLLGLLGFSTLRGPGPNAASSASPAGRSAQLAPGGKPAALNETGQSRLLAPLVEFLSQEGGADAPPVVSAPQKWWVSLLRCLGGTVGPACSAGKHQSVCGPVKIPVDRGLEPILLSPEYFLYRFVVEAAGVPPPAFTDAKYDVETMIVDVPDPTESTVGYDFDVIVESLQSAMSQEGFIPDRYYLPWQQHKSATAPDPKAGPNRDDAASDREPGVLLFRSIAGGRLLVVFLVGESPVLGIHKGAFDSAAELILSGLNELQERRRDLSFRYVRPPCVRVLGPFFSGGADSLALAIAHVSQRHNRPLSLPPAFRVLSGSAYNVDKNAFETACGGHTLFQSTTVFKDLLENELIQFATSHKSLSNEPVRIAWLTESNTDYGQPIPGLALTRPRRDSMEVDFPFPMHISAVRSAFGSAQNTPKQDAQVLNLNRYKLSIPFDDAQEPRDMIPAFSPKLTPALVELLLARILTAIHQGHFEYVGITATDARDTIFLAELLRQYCPDAQLLIAGSDPLYTRPEAEAFLRGALLASPYPMTSAGHEQASDHMGGKKTHVEFASDDCQGVYNAAIILRHYETLDANTDHAALRGLFKLVEARGAFLAMLRNPFSPNLPVIRRPGLIGYHYEDFDAALRANPGGPAAFGLPDSCQPPIWITAIGNDGFWPLQIRSIRQAIDAHPKTREAQQNRDQFNAYTFAARVRPQPVQRPGLKTAKKGHDPNPPTHLRTHVDATNRCLFAVILLVSLLEAVQYFRAQTFWSNRICRLSLWDPDPEKRLDRQRREYRWPACRCLAGRIVPLVLVAFFAWALAAIRIADLARDSISASGLFCPCYWILISIAVILFLVALSDPKDDGWKVRTVFGAGAAAVYVLTGWALLFEIRATEEFNSLFTEVLDLVILGLATAASAGLIHVLVSSIVSCRWPRETQEKASRQAIWSLMVTPVVLCLFLWFLRSFGSGENLEWLLLFYERSASALNGLSLWTAVVLLAAAFWCLAAIRDCSWDVLETVLPYRPWPESAPKRERADWRRNDLNDATLAVETMLRHPIRWFGSGHRGAILSTIVLVIWFFLRLARTIGTVYDGWLSFAFQLGLVLLLVCWVIQLFGTLSLLKELQRMFDLVAALPVRASFGRLLPLFMQLLPRFLWSVRTPRKAHFEIACAYEKDLFEQRRAALPVTRDLVDKFLDEMGKGKRVLRCNPASNPLSSGCIQGVHTFWRVIEKTWSDPLPGTSDQPPAPAAPGPAGAGPAAAGAAPGPAGAGPAAAGAAPGPAGAGPAAAGAAPGAAGAGPAAAGGAPGAAGTAKSWNGRAADLLAIWIVFFCNPLLRLARRTFVLLGVVALLFLLAATAYPAQPQGLLGRTAVTIIGVLGVLTLLFIYQIERNELINAIAKTDPGKITWDFGFITQALVLLVIPAVILVGNWFPDAADWLQKLVDPISRLVK